MSVVLDNVSRTVGGVSYIRNLSLTLEKGTLSVLLGPTLSGKTSLMRLLAGLDVPDSGKVMVEGEDVTGLDVRRRSVAMVYQQFINYPSLTVYENIASPLRVKGLKPKVIDTRVRETAKLLKLDPLLDRMPLQLSGGQQQRTAIARAWSRAPISSCSTSHSPISTTSCARNCAQKCRASSKPPARSSSTPPPSRRKRCCLAAGRSA